MAINSLMHLRLLTSSGYNLPSTQPRDFNQRGARQSSGHFLRMYVLIKYGGYVEPWPIIKVSLPLESEAA
jgi:hypothetical protein